MPMIPLADMHCHLLAGLDDGPATASKAMVMCRRAFQEGVRLAAATAHQNDAWSGVTPERIRRGTEDLNVRLRAAGLPLTVFPSAEIMAFSEMEAAWQEQKLLSVADQGKYLLVEMPRHGFVDLRSTAKCFRKRGIRLILAHPERQPELLHEPGQIEALIEEGCLVQVSSGSVTNSDNPQDRLAIKKWFQRGVVHLLGSDGHSLTKRPPAMAAAYRQIARWTDAAVADRICSTNGLVIFQGLQLQVAKPRPRTKRWFARLWQGRGAF
jgi:protein-tyrosine phosphatase